MKLFTLLAIFINLSAFSQAEKDWKTLTEDNYTINYPDTWTLNTTGQMGTRFILFSPKLSSEDKFSENVNLLKQDISAYGLDLDTYSELSEKQLATVITDAKVIESKRINTGALPYHKLIYTGKQGALNLTFEQYYWVIDGNAYILTFTCEESQFDAYKTTGEKILNSFRWVEN